MVYLVDNILQFYFHFVSLSELSLTSYSYRIEKMTFQQHSLHSDVRYHLIRSSSFNMF